MTKQKLVVIGNGMAGVRFVQRILEQDSKAYDITIFGSEKHAGYSRLMLSSVLQGESSFEEIILQTKEWYEENQIELFTGETVTEIDSQQKAVCTSTDRRIHYDKLVIATGSSPFILPVKGADKEGVISFRTVEDCREMTSVAKRFKKAAVIGGGVLGLEAAKGLLNLGMEVQVIHISDSIMERQLDQQASSMLQQELERQGMSFLLGKATKEITGADRVKEVHFQDGTKIAADLVVMAAGVRPNCLLAEKSGIQNNRGILVNDFLQTNIKDIYAIGECAEHNGMVYGLVEPLYEQAEIAAKHLCKKPTEGYSGSVLSTHLKVSGVEVFSAGEIHSTPLTKAIHYFNEVEGVYKKILFRENKAVGAVMYGDTRDGARLQEVILKKKMLSDEDKAGLLKTRDPADSPVASYSFDQPICHCNSVSKGAIIKAVQTDGLSTIKEIKKVTKASGSCGGCRPAVGELLAFIQSDTFDQHAAEEQAVCSCTDLTEDELVHQIQVHNLRNAKQVREKLSWKTEVGCPTCNLALDYYLGMIGGSAEKKGSGSQHEKINDSQEDGFTLIPQLYGGEATVEQLKKIISAAEKIPGVKIALGSDQRIHLLGLKKEERSIAVETLDMPLRSLTDNSIETIKTDVGNQICQCDKQSSIEMARRLEYILESLRMPYRLKIGLSSCMHNGAGSTTKDIGVIEINGKWEVYIGGSSGRNARKGQLLSVMHEAEQAEELIVGFIQYYRESARFLERTWEWMERLGLVHIREVLFDQEICHQLISRLLEDKEGILKQPTKAPMPVDH
ncbi:nitrite reductase large subunit NirB [Jeotgalibacillus proteolyticus]|uniref:Nitrite reductase large subunit n=1 Tax=Jeotgalibacillus proteolyticus TaxID=2082395 RepID=A0A2S5GDK8_9BACL|nr:nitrite reductase large subunit NirB [Jeotgalibacillus proteolyticus]PPA71001.1 nitrite reductase large subunit [Jeotgalibacillus proteolyticus]